MLSMRNAKRRVGAAACSTGAASCTAKASSGMEPAWMAAPGATNVPPRLTRREVGHPRVDRVSLLGVDARRALAGRPAVGEVARLLLVVAGRVALLDARR